MDYRESILRLYASGLHPLEVVDVMEKVPEPSELFRKGKQTGKRFGLRNSTVEKISRGVDYAKLAGYYNSMEKLRIEMILPDDKGYPPMLREIGQPPAALFSRGNKEIGLENCAAVVGSRKCSGYGRRIATIFSEELSTKGITIVSGLAYGIDSIAHRATLKAGGKTIAVLGSGPDIVYPASAAPLFEEIIDKGRIISEFPPGTNPRKFHFPLRNRVISGLSKCIIVVEAGKKSGALITAKHAADQGRDVFSTPGSIFSETSYGTNRLIEDGAIPALSSESVLMESFPELLSKSTYSPIRLSAEEQRIVKLFPDDGIYFDNLLEKSALDIGELSRILLNLEIKGICTDRGGKNFVLLRKWS